MKINYFNQAWNAVRQQPVVSTVSIIGTALAIFLIMIVVMIEEVKVAPYAPESNRDRWLVYRFGTLRQAEWEENNSSNGPLSYKTVRQVFYPLESAEAVSAFCITPLTASLSVPGQPAFGVEVLDVDAAFWKVMDFTFINGKPFSQEDFEAGIPLTVISESTARRLFGSTDVEGREVSINHVPYRVSGVVKDVTNLASYSYAEAWVPYTSTNIASSTWGDDIMGSLSVVILAKSKDDFPKIREELTENFGKYGDEIKLKGWVFEQRERPYTQEVEQAYPFGTNETPDMGEVYRKRSIVFLILLMVPAVNLSSMTQSRLHRRSEEIGIRRAFGARRSNVIGDILIENLIITVIAGLLGLILCLLFGLIWGDHLFIPGFGISTAAKGISFGMLFHWSTFGTAMLFCFLLNLLSSGIPALNASRINIVSAISGKR